MVYDHLSLEEKYVCDLGNFAVDAWLERGLIARPHLVTPHFVDPQMIGELLDQTTLAVPWFTFPGNIWQLQERPIRNGPTYLSVIRDLCVLVVHPANTKREMDLVKEQLLSISAKETLKLKLKVMDYRLEILDRSI
jgi:hypothetical protein